MISASAKDCEKPRLLSFLARLVNATRWLRARKRILRAAALALFAVLVTLLLLAYGVYSYTGDTSPVAVDAAIVLGATIDGDQPSPVFRERINHGIALVRSGKVRWLILTGGRPNGCAHAESFVARQYAIQNGVPREKILTEAESHTTYQNLYYARQLAQTNSLHTFIVVSDPYHLRRAMQMAEELGLDAHPSPTPTSKLNTAGFLMKETCRNAKYLVHHTLSPNAMAEELSVHAH